MKSFKRIILVLVLLLVVLAGVGFVRLNQDAVSLWLLTDFSPRPVGQWVLLAFIAGGLSGILAGLGLLRHLKTRFKQHSLESRLHKLAEENEQLKRKGFRELSE